MAHDADTERFTRAMGRGDLQRAFEVLLRRHAREVGRLCFAMTGSQSDAEELTQEVFLAVHRALPRFQGRSKPSTWIHTIARRTCARALARRRSQGQLLRSAAEAEGSLPGATHDPLPLLERRDQGRALRRALLALPQGQQEVLLLRHVAGLPYREVAQACDISEEAARQRACAGLRRLRSALQQERSPGVEAGEPLAADRGEPTGLAHVVREGAR